MKLKPPSRRGPAWQAAKQRVKEIVRTIRVNVRCVDCRHRWSVGPGEVPNDAVPICPACGSVGVPVSAEVR